MRVAFIGLGNMGGPMAINLKRAGYTVQAFDLSADAIAKVRALMSEYGLTLADLGGKAAPAPAKK